MADWGSIYPVEDEAAAAHDRAAFRLLQQVRPAGGRSEGLATGVMEGAVPGMLGGMLKAAATPGALMKPNPYPPGSEEAAWYDRNNGEVAQHWGPEMAMNLVGTGTPFSMSGSAGIFGGRLAQTADHAKLARAESMAEQGATPSMIRDVTGAPKIQLSPGGVPHDFDWSLARKAEDALPSDAARALDTWVGGPPDAAANGQLFGVWHPGPLKKALADPEIGPKIEAAIRPVREALRAKHGDTVTLYRHHGDIPEGAKPHDLLSFTNDRNVAESMSGAARKDRRVYNDADIAAKEAELEKTGKAKFGNHWLENFTEDFGNGPVTYTGIMRGDGFVTDTPNVRAYMESLNADAHEANAARSAKLGKVKEYKIPVDDIVAATDRFNQREFIVRNSKKLFGAAGTAGAGNAMWGSMAPQDDGGGL